MFLCCVESLSLFQSKLDLLQIFKIVQKSGRNPCTQSRAKFFPKFKKFFILYFNTYTCTYVV